MVKSIDPNQELVELTEKNQSLIQKVKSIAIKTVGDLKQTVELRQEIKKRLKELTGLKDFLLKHPKEQIKEINARFSPHEDILEDADDELKKKQEAYEEERLRKEEEEREKARQEQEEKYKKEQEKAKKKGIDAPPPPAPVETTTQEKVDGLTFRKKADFRIIDEVKIPFMFAGLQLMKADEKNIRKLVTAGIKEIPGLEIFERKISSISMKEDEEI